MNTGAWPSLGEARSRVLEIQTKLHRWASDDADRRFDDLFNLVVDPATLIVAWHRVRGNKGARSAGVDGQTARPLDRGWARRGCLLVRPSGGGEAAAVPAAAGA